MSAIAGKHSHKLPQRNTLNAQVENQSLNRQVIGTNAADDVRERLAATGVAVRKTLYWPSMSCDCQSKIF